MIRVNEYIYYLESTDNPLSARVYVISGNEYTYIYDVGATRQARELIDNILNRRIIISHFHTDHIENLKFFYNDKENLFIGDYTNKILGYGNVITKMLEIEDGINLKIIPIPSSHSKGALGLIINDEYLLIGDALEGNRFGLNVTKLNELIKTLKELKFKYILIGHKSDILQKVDVIRTLEYYFSKREKNKPYIGYDVL